MKVEKSNWKRLQLKSLLKECSVKNRSLELSNVYSVTNSKGFVPASDYFDNTVQSNNLSTYKIVDKGMFAYNPSRINVGSIALLSAEDRVIVSPLYVIFSIVGNLNPNYLLRFLKSEIGLSLIRSKTSGSVRASLRFKDLASIELPVPSLSEQESIASELDALQEVIDGYREQIADLDDLAQSIFLTTFGDPVANSKGWEVKQLQDIVTDDCKLSYGIVQPGEEVPNGVPVVRSIDMSSPVIYLKNLKRVDPSIAQKYQRTKLEGDEIFISCRGVTGVISLASEELKGGNITRGLVSARLKLGERLFVYYCLRMPQINSIIQDRTKGATLRQINVKDIRLLPIIFPPIDMQKAFAAQMDSINLQNNLLRQQLADAEMLMAERMQYYFS
jgi:type I restriction enzyme S subunit